MTSITRTLISVVVAGILSASDTDAAETYHIGVSLGLTGQYAVQAEMQQRGYQLWEKDVNGRGGLDGREVQIQVIDDHGDKDKVREAYSAFIREYKVDMTFGPYSSALTSVAAEVVAAHGYSMLVAGAAASGIWNKGYRNIFGLFSPASRYTKGMLALSLERDLSELAIVHADDLFSRAAAAGTRKWAVEYGLTIVMYEEFEKGQRNLDDLARAARQAGAKIVIVAGHFDESVDMRTAFERIDWYPSAYYATIGPTLPKYLTTLGPDAELSFSSTFWRPDSNIPGAMEFKTRFGKRYGADPSYHAAAAYAAGQILEDAVELAKSLNRSQTNNALYELDTETILGRYGVDRTGMQAKHFPLIIQWQDNRKKIVWPKGHRTAEPQFR